MKCTECNREIRPVVAVDIDGTLAQYHETITTFAARYFDRAVPTFAYDGNEPFRDYLELTQAEHRQMKLAFRQGGNKRFLKPYQGASEFVDDLRLCGAEVWVATTRPWQRLDNIDPDTQEWLRRNHIKIDGLLFGEDKYQQLIDAVGLERVPAVFDDLAEQIDIAVSLGLPAFQVSRPHNSHASQRREPYGTLTSAIVFGHNNIHRWRKDHDKSC